MSTRTGRLPWLIFAVLAAPVAAPAAPPTVGAPPPVRGYLAACGACHENSGYAVQRITARVGPERARLSRRCDLDAAALRVIVRRGILAMPPLSRVEVSDAELEGIVRELTPPPDCTR